MPIYEYVCEECKTHFEALVSLSSSETIKCKECGGVKVKKTLSASSFRMGSGQTSMPSGPSSGCCAKGGFS